MPRSPIFEAQDKALRARAERELNLFLASLSETARQHILELDRSIDNITLQIGFKQFLDRVEDPTLEPPIFDFFATRTEDQRQQIFLAEPGVLTLSSLALPTNYPDFANIFWVLGAFYASSAYKDGDYLEGPNLRRGLVYLRRAMTLDLSNERAVDDQAVVLLSIVGNSGEGGDSRQCLQQAVDLLTALQQRRVESGRPTLQRVACNLAWAYLGLSKYESDPRELVQKAYAVLAGDDLLNHPFRVPGRSDPGIVRTTRACVLVRQAELQPAGAERSRLLSEAMDDLEAALANPVPSVRRVILEETNPNRDLGLLLEGSFAPRVLVLRKRLAEIAEG